MSKEKFGGGAAVVMAMAGSAIGLGNLWRFPYMVGQNGGAAFVLVYLVSIVLLSLPVFYSESVIGRATGANTFGAIDTLAPGSKWKLLGLLTILSPIIIMAFYSVVGGWSISYFFESVTSGFHEGDGIRFGGFISSVWGPLVCHTVFLGLTALIVSLGVISGIERFNKISLPLLFVLMITIMVYSLTLPGAREGVRYLVAPDFSKLTGGALADAVGQGFFSLSLGVGSVLTYSSYMKKEGRIIRYGFGTAFFDVMFALIAGFAIMPAVFSSGLEPGAGPGLIFETLPYIFSKMSAGAPLVGTVVPILFFLTVVVAALTSSISMFEVVVAYLVEEKHIPRRKATLMLFALCWALGIICSLSFGPLAGVKIFGRNIFDACDILTSNFFMMFGGLLFVIFAGWKMKRKTVIDELTNNGSLKAASKLAPALYFLMKYVAPLFIIAIFISGLLSL